MTPVAPGPAPPNTTSTSPAPSHPPPTHFHPSAHAHPAVPHTDRSVSSSSVGTMGSVGSGGSAGSVEVCERLVGEGGAAGWWGAREVGEGGMMLYSGSVGSVSHNSGAYFSATTEHQPYYGTLTLAPAQATTSLLPHPNLTPATPLPDWQSDDFIQRLVDSVLPPDADFGTFCGSDLAGADGEQGVEVVEGEGENWWDACIDESALALAGAPDSAAEGSNDSAINIVVPPTVGLHAHNSQTAPALGHLRALEKMADMVIDWDGRAEGEAGGAGVQASPTRSPRKRSRDETIDDSTAATVSKRAKTTTTSPTPPPHRSSPPTVPSPSIPQSSLDLDVTALLSPCEAVHSEDARVCIALTKSLEVAAGETVHDLVEPGASSENGMLEHSGSRAGGCSEEYAQEGAADPLHDFVLPDVDFAFGDNPFESGWIDVEQAGLVS